MEENFQLLLDSNSAGLEKIASEQNKVTQELFIIRNKQSETVSKFTSIQSFISHLEEIMTDIKSKVQTQKSSASITPNLTHPQRTSVIVKNPEKKSISKMTTTSKDAPSKNLKKMLFIGDALSKFANVKEIENEIKGKVITSKAYTSVFDQTANIAKDAPHFPDRNFLHVVPNEALKDSYDHLIVQAGSVDISNLKTNVDNPYEYMHYYEQEAVKSAKYVFESCVTALEKQPSLRSVILMQQTPRYDNSVTDPLSLKASLSQLFNNTLNELHNNSMMKHKIFIGKHDLECVGSVRAARYIDVKTGKFDGVHLYGRLGTKAYTNSVLNILKAAFLSNSQAPFGRNYTSGNW